MNDEDKNSVPLIIRMETAKTELINAVNDVAAKSGLPAFLLLPLFEGLVADLKVQKANELINTLTAQNTPKTEGGEGC